MSTHHRSLRRRVRLGRVGARLGALALLAGPLVAGTPANSVDHLAALAAELDPSVATDLGRGSVRLPGLGDDFGFVAGGQLYEHEDGTARLSGLIARDGDREACFALDLVFDGRRRPGERPRRAQRGPNKKLVSSSYADAGGPVDPATWRYYTRLSGTLTGLDELHGAVFQLSGAGAPLQIGFGASNRNLDHGASVGFTGTLVKAPSSGDPLPTSILSASVGVDLEIEQDHIADGAQADPLWTRFRGEHALVLAGLGRFDFVSGGRLVELADGTARLTGLVAKRRDRSQQLFIDVELSDRINPGESFHPPTMSPKLTLRNDAYLPTGVIDPSLWHYYRETRGTLSGRDGLAGLELELEGMGPAFQIGLGANGVNLDYGAAGWLRVRPLSDGPGDQDGDVLALGDEGDTGDLLLTLRGESQDCIDRALVDKEVYGGGGGHALWLPGIGKDFVFESGGQLIELANGTARLTGVVARLSDPDQKLMVDVELRERVDPGAPDHPPSGSPKRELRKNAYAEKGGPIDPSSWRYYLITDGMLTGLEELAGGLIHVGRRGPAFQIGLGANGKNTEYGASGWLDVLILSQPTQGPKWSSMAKGDFNLDLGGDCPECPDTARAGDGLGVDPNVDTAFWLPGIGTDFDFEPGAQFVERRDGTATLSGTIARRSNPDERFAVHVDLSQRVNPGGVGFVPEGSPKQDLPPTVYVENGGPVDTNAWRYYLMVEGTLTGLDDLAGALYSIGRRGPAPQVGLAASGRNLNFGAASWIVLEALNLPQGGPNLPQTVQGDFNLDLARNCP